MITWFCTRKLLKVLGRKAVENPESATTVLGDWHANLVPTCGGELIVFANNRTMATVAVPLILRSQLEPFFVARVENLLAMPEVPTPAIQLESDGIMPIQYSRARDQRLLGHLRVIASEYQYRAEEHDGKTELSLSDTELVLTQMPHLSSLNIVPMEEIQKLFDPNRN